MAITDDQYQRLLARVTSIERMLNDVAVALQKFVTLGQVQQITTLVQTEQEDIRTRMDALEERVEVIENEPLS